MSGAVVADRTLDLAADRRTAWAIVSDTDRLNRASGLGQVSFEPVSGRGAARFIGRTVSGGIPLRYEERPFEWVTYKSFAVRRVMEGGLVAAIETRFGLDDAPAGGTRVALQIRVEPRTALVAPIVRMTANRSAERLVAAIRDAAAQGGFPRAPVTAARAADLARAAAELRRAVRVEDRAIAERVIRFVDEAADVDVDRIRPYEVAAEWGTDRRATLGVFLHGVVAGLLELRWDVVCPSCRGAPQRAGSLGEIPPEGHCLMCDISFDLELDRALEATFRPSAAVRSIDSRPFCSGGPARTPHVVAQAILPSSGRATLEAPAEAGRYRVFARGGHTASVDVTPEGAGEVTVRCTPAGVEPTRIAVAPGGRVVVEQEAGEERHVKLEHLEWASRAATAAEIATLPVFRRLFAKDVLRTGVTLRVARVALFFSDLTGSTALYTEAGDAAAFRMVQDHFDLLARVIEVHRGAVVKTMGDAVMAAFVDEADAVRAAIEAQREYQRFAEARDDARGTRLRVGVFSGPCYGVTANGLLDYFGQTVNVASRLEHQAAPGEVVLAEELAARGITEGWLEANAVSGAFEAALKGVAGPMRLVRVAAG